jgi:hypothetical protein
MNFGVSARVLLENKQIIKWIKTGEIPMIIEITAEDFKKAYKDYADKFDLDVDKLTKDERNIAWLHYCMTAEKFVKAAEEMVKND